jgi:hypothetical protein
MTMPGRPTTKNATCQGRTNPTIGRLHAVSPLTSAITAPPMSWASPTPR